MKLVRIKHIRCGECVWGSYTYMLAKDEITQEQLEKDVKIASKNYLKAKEDFIKLGIKPSCDYNRFNLPKDITIAEGEEILKKQDEELKRWRGAEADATGNFGRWMKDLGYLYLDDDKTILKTEIDWKHNHHLNIDYSKTEIDVKMGESEIDIFDLC